MRILLVANTLPPADLSGVGEQVVQLAAGLRARGHEVEILGRPERGWWSAKVWYPWTSFWRTFRRVRAGRPDVVQLHESDSGLAALAVRLQRRPIRPLLVVLLQVSYVEERRAVRPLTDRGRVLGNPSSRERRFRRCKAPLQILLGRLGARLADLVLAPSERTAREIERDYGVRGVRVLPNVTGGLERPPDPARRPTGLDDYLLFVGRLRVRKGLEVLVAALGLLREQGRRLDLVVAGDGEHRGAFEAAVRREGLGGQVHLLGRCAATEVRGLLERARCLVVPSTYEGMPLVVLEAMEAGVPVVASAVSGIPEVVVDGETGWLVPPEDAAALAAALDAATAGAEAARRGAQGRRRVEALYRPGHAARLWEEWIAGAEPVAGVAGT